MNSSSAHRDCLSPSFIDHHHQLPDLHVGRRPVSFVGSQQAPLHTLVLTNGTLATCHMNGGLRPARRERPRKILTAQGLRDRRVRLSIGTSRRFFDLQDMLGFDKASKTLEWLLRKSKHSIEKLSRTKLVVINNPDEVTLSPNCHSSDNSGVGASSFMSLGGESLSREGRRTEDTDRLATSNSDDVLTRDRSRAKARARARERIREKLTNWKIRAPNALVEDDAQNLLPSLLHSQIDTAASPPRPFASESGKTKQSLESAGRKPSSIMGHRHENPPPNNYI
ncbi:hypothetical protein SAY87_014114 [Trapa incisa]|uniref:Uncharacterized protein n=1 Tax=Trapa incisa TaxID=236973 RepID=A0AAN7GV36_9MYRT|nr:hypothetical protein SAY87_014114 [Trapa incisa]